MRIGQAMADYLWELDAAGGRPVAILELARITKRDGYRKGWQYEPAYNLIRSGLATPDYVWVDREKPRSVAVGSPKRHRALTITEFGTAVVAEWRRQGYRKPRSYNRRKPRRRKSVGVKKSR